MSEPTGNAAKAKAAAARNADSANVDHGRDPRSRYDMVHPAGEQADELSPSDARPQGAQFASTDVPPRGAFDSAQAAAAGGGTEQVEGGLDSAGTPSSSLDPSTNAFGGGSSGQGVRSGFPGLGADGRGGPSDNPGPSPDVPGNSTPPGVSGNGTPPGVPLNGPPQGRGDGGENDGQTNPAPIKILDDGARVDENAEAGTVAATLEVIDPNQGDTHSLRVLGDSPFEVIGNELRVREGAELDFEGQQAYQVTVEATDSAGNTYQQVVPVTIGDVNEAPTGIGLDGQSVAENAAGGTVVGTLSALDPDFDDSASYEVVGDSPFTIADGKLVLRAGAEPNYEDQQAHKVSIKATDEGGLSTTKTFNIDVQDVLEAPEVTGALASGTEDKPLDLSPLIDIATGGQAGELSVQIAGVPEGAVLSAGQDNGDGTWSLAPSDLEGLTLSPPQNSDEDFTLNVTATMTGEGGETALTTAKLPVSLDPVADAPKLALAGGDTSEIVLRVAADSWKGDPNLRLEVDGETIGNWKVSADHGAGEWETIRVSGDFSENGPQEVKVGFTNDAYGGTPDTDRNLYVDRIEVNGKAYEAEGEGVDYGHRDAQEAMKWAGKLTFDTSDNPGPNAGIAGDEDTAIALDLSAALTDTDGSESLSVTVAGLPEGAELSAGEDNGDGTWTLEPGDLDGLTLTPPQDYNGNFTLQVTATATEAANGDTASTAIEVPVQVAPVNDAPTTPALGIVIPENAEGALAGMISASDPDKGDTLDFSVSDERFEVKDGVLKLKDGQSLDYEAEPFVNLSVTATDSHGASASQDFTVNVWDVNEAPTGIEPGGFTVVENAPGGTLLATLDAVDPDTGDTHGYEVQGDYADGIEVRGNQLFLKDGAQIDYEQGAEYDIPVKVTDSAGNSHVETITAAIKDVNEAPQGESIPDQKAGPDQPLDLNVSGYFSDEDAGDKLTYSMEGPEWLSIDPETGQISGAPQPAEQTLEMQGGLYDLPSGGKVVLDTEMLSSFAGFNNSIGYYLADGEGNPLSGEIVYINVKDFDAKSTEIDLSAEPGAKSLGLFLIPDGADRAEALSDGVKVTFAEKGGGWEAVINDDGQTAQTWFSDAALNSDGFDHLTDNEIEGNLNWEDLRGGGDKDFGDVNMTAKVTAIAPETIGESETVTVTATDEGGLSASQTFALAPATSEDSGGDENLAPEKPEGRVLEGTAADDSFVNVTDADTVQGGAGYDTVNSKGSDEGFSLDMGESSIEQAIGSKGDDELYASGLPEAARISGRGGDDTLIGSAFDDELYGGNGDDQIMGNAGNDRLDGGAGADKMLGGAGDDSFLDVTDADTIYGGAGHDVVDSKKSDQGFSLDMGESSIEQAIGSKGDDNLDASGLSQATRLSGRGGDDTLTGSAFGDELFGGSGNDSLIGGDGDDMLKGGDGDDTIVSGGGSDAVVFTGGNDTITDFDTNAQDKGEAGNQDENSFDTLRVNGTDFDGKYSSVEDFVGLVRAMQTDDSGESEAFAAPGSDDLTLSFARYEDGEATHSVTLEGVLGKDGLRAALEAEDIEGFRQPDEPREAFDGGDIVRGVARVGGPDDLPGVAVDGAGRGEAAEFLMFDSGEDESAFDGARGGWIDAVETGVGAGHAYSFDPRSGDWTSQIDNAGRPKPEDKSRVLSDEADPSVSPAEDDGGAGSGAQEIGKMDWS